MLSENSCLRVLLCQYMSLTQTVTIIFLRFMRKMTDSLLTDDLLTDSLRGAGERPFNSFFFKCNREFI